MIYSEYPIDMAGIVCQVADPISYPINEFSSDGTRKPKENAQGEKQYEVQLMITSQGRMTLDRVKVWSADGSPVEGMEAGQVVDLFMPSVYVGVANDGKKFYGLKAKAVSKAGK